MNESPEIMVVKHDGCVEAFDAAKPRRCLVAAMNAGPRNDRIADALARAVELHLRQWRDERPPTTDYIFRCLRTALRETGMEQVACELARHRRQRATRRSRLSVRDSRSREHVLFPWRKTHVAESLERQYGLSHPAARILATEIERRVLALDYTVISTALIAELVRNELLAWGLADSVAGGVSHPDAVAKRQAGKGY